MGSRKHHATCAHFRAEPTGPTEARLLPDGRWSYETPYQCPACGARFIETHAQAAPVR